MYSYYAVYDPVIVLMVLSYQKGYSDFDRDVRIVVQDPRVHRIVLALGYAIYLGKALDEVGIGDIFYLGISGVVGSQLVVLLNVEGCKAALLLSYVIGVYYLEHSLIVEDSNVDMYIKIISIRLFKKYIVLLLLEYFYLFRLYSKTINIKLLRSMNIMDMSIIITYI